MSTLYFQPAGDGVLVASTTPLPHDADAAEADAAEADRRTRAAALRAQGTIHVEAARDRAAADAAKWRAEQAAARKARRAQVEADAKASGYHATIATTEEPKQPRRYFVTVTAAGVVLATAHAGSLEAARRLAQEAVDRDEAAAPAA